MASPDTRRLHEQAADGGLSEDEFFSTVDDDASETRVTTAPSPKQDESDDDSGDDSSDEDSDDSSDDDSDASEESSEPVPAKKKRRGGQ